MTSNAIPTVRPPDRLRRLLTIAIAIVLVSIPLRIVGHGWLPQDDVRRHAAKPFAERDWSEIVLLRDGLTVDLHAGWHALLGGARSAGLDSPRALALAAIVALAALFFLAPLPRFRRPEAWVFALATVAILEPSFFPRLLSGRPLVLSMTVLALVAASWTAARAPAVAPAHLIVWTLLFALATWAHGNWYLWLLPLAAFAAAGEGRAALRLGGCWLAGTALGATLTGQPVDFLVQWVRTVLWSFSDHELTGALVTEFQPGQGSGALLLAVALLLIVRRGRSDRALHRDPLFLLAAAAWLLGLAVSRFWTDWGVPALLVWGARALEAEIEPLERRPGPRLALAGAATLALLLAVTGNRNDRWTSREGDRHLRLDRPDHAAALPDAGGTLYSNSMGLFYDTFFGNPRAPFRYAVGFEPGLMPPEDRAIFRALQRHGGSDESFLPWVRKLRPEDRIAVARPGGPPPEIAGLEWSQPFAGLWLGRLRTPPPGAGRSLQSTSPDG